jgi:DNA-binding XRE family transcriptional regulator
MHLTDRVRFALMLAMSREEFKEMRERLGLTSMALAKALGVNRTTVQRYERGITPVPRATQIALGALLAADDRSAPPSQAAE